MHTPSDHKVPRGLVAAAAALMLLLGVTVAGQSVFTSSSLDRSPSPQMGVAAAAAEETVKPVAERPAPALQPDAENAVAELDTRVKESTELRLARSVGKLAAAAATNADGNANASPDAATTGANVNALDEVRAAAEETAKSTELQGAVKSIWRVAWEKSWPFLKGTAVKFWGLMVQAWQALATVGRSSQTDTNVNANTATNVNAAAGTNSTP